MRRGCQGSTYLIAASVGPSVRIYAVSSGIRLRSLLCTGQRGQNARRHSDGAWQGPARSAIHAPARLPFGTDICVKSVTQLGTGTESLGNQERGRQEGSNSPCPAGWVDMPARGEIKHQTPQVMPSNDDAWSSDVMRAAPAVEAALLMASASAPCLMCCFSSTGPAARVH